MSYDLTFWKEDPGTRHDPQATYERLSKGERVEGLEELPIEKMLEVVRVTFRKGWTQPDDQTWEAEAFAKGFQVYTTPQFFRVDCGGMTGDDMNIFIEIAAEFGCPLFDPQVGKRFDGP